MGEGYILHHIYFVESTDWQTADNLSKSAQSQFSPLVAAGTSSKSIKAELYPDIFSTNWYHMFQIHRSACPFKCSKCNRTPPHTPPPHHPNPSIPWPQNPPPTPKSSKSRTLHIELLTGCQHESSPPGITTLKIHSEHALTRRRRWKRGVDGRWRKEQKKCECVPHFMQSISSAALLNQT